MPLNKSAFRRYVIIARSLKRSSRNALKSREDIQSTILDEMGTVVSLSTIEKDIRDMRHDSDMRIYAPIKSYRGGRIKGNSGYYIEEEWDFFDALRNSWG